MRNSRTVRAVLAASVALTLSTGLVTAYNQTSNPSGSAPLTEAIKPAVPPVRLASSIPPGAQQVGIVDPLVITATDGTLSTVTLTGPDGKPLPGTLSPDRTRWTSTLLAFKSNYTIAATGADVEGKPGPALNATFRTVTPARTLAVTAVRPSNGQTVGVAMPISIYFNKPVTDKAAVERALTVSPSVATEGSFHWMSSQRVHWRPKEFWKPGTTVKVNSSLRGVDAGGGTFGAGDHASSFTIGANHHALGDAAAHTVTLFENDKPIKTFPASFGQAKYPSQWGMHVAYEKHPTKRMRSESWGGPSEGESGFYDEVLPLAVRISSNGEFVHVNGATVRQQGRSNVSHGCVNLSPANGRFFYDWVQIGDPVNIVNSSRPLTPADGDISDWLFTWDDYVAGSALHNKPPAPVATPDPAAEPAAAHSN